LEQKGSTRPRKVSAVAAAVGNSAIETEDKVISVIKERSL